MATETPVVESAEEETFLFRHKAYRRFRVGRFEFKNNLLRLNAADRDEFLELVKDPKFPRMDALNIVEVNEEAARVAEVSVFDSPPNDASTVVRGAMQAGDIKTAKDSQTSGAQQSKPGSADLNPNPTGPGAAFTGLK